MIKAAAVLFGVMAATSAAADPLKLGGTAPDSFNAALATALCDAIGETCVPDETTADGSGVDPVSDLLAGRSDLALGIAADTAGVALSQAYAPPAIKAAYAGTQSFIDVPNATSAVAASSAFAAHLLTLDRAVQPYETTAAAFDAMMDGQADLVLAEAAWLDTKVARTSRIVVIVERKDLPADPLHIALRPADVELAERIDRALTMLQDNGILESLRQEFGASSSGL